MPRCSYSLRNLTIHKTTFVSTAHFSMLCAALTDRDCHDRSRLLYLLRSQLPVARTGSVPFAAMARTRVASLGTLPKRGVLSGPGGARAAEHVSRKAFGFPSRRSRTHCHPCKPQHDRVFFHLF